MSHNKGVQSQVLLSGPDSGPLTLAAPAVGAIENTWEQLRIFQVLSGFIPGAAEFPDRTCDWTPSKCLWYRIHTGTWPMNHSRCSATVAANGTKSQARQSGFWETKSKRTLTKDIVLEVDRPWPCALVKIWVTTDELLNYQKLLRIFRQKCVQLPPSSPEFPGD